MSSGGDYSGKTEIFGLDTQSLIGLLELLHIDSNEWRVKESRVKDSPAVLEKDVYFSGEISKWTVFKSWFSWGTKEPVQVTGLRNNNIRFWGRDAVYYLAAFNPLLLELNEAGKTGTVSPEPQRYRKSVSDFFKVHYQNKNPTLFEEDVGVLLEGFALGGETSKIKDVTRSIEVFLKRRPGQKSFAQLLAANERYWVATKSDPQGVPAILEKAFNSLGIDSNAFGLDVNMVASACMGLNQLEAIAERTDLVCRPSEQYTSFDIAMISLFTQLDERQDVLLKWLVPQMFALYQKTALCPEKSVKSSQGVCIPVIPYFSKAKKIIKHRIAEQPKIFAKPVPAEESVVQVRELFLSPPPPPPPKGPEQQYRRPKAYN